MPEQESLSLWTILQGFAAIIVAAQMAITGWMLKEIVSIENDIAAMKSNRFTNADGLDMYKQIQQGRETPPPWFAQFQLNVDQRLTRIESKIDRTQ